MSSNASASATPSAWDVLPNLVSLGGSMSKLPVYLSVLHQTGTTWYLASAPGVCSGLSAWGLNEETEWMLQTQEVGLTLHSETRSLSFFPPPAAPLAFCRRRGGGHVLAEHLLATRQCHPLYMPAQAWFWMDRVRLEGVQNVNLTTSKNKYNSNWLLLPSLQVCTDTKGWIKWTHWGEAWSWPYVVHFYHSACSKLRCGHSSDFLPKHKVWTSGRMTDISNLQAATVDNNRHMSC